MRFSVFQIIRWMPSFGSESWTCIQSHTLSFFIGKPYIWIMILICWKQTVELVFLDVAMYILLTFWMLQVFKCMYLFLQLKKIFPDEDNPPSPEGSSLTHGTYIFFITLNLLKKKWSVYSSVSYATNIMPIYGWKSIILELGYLGIKWQIITVSDI